jgi:hypothetical protein
MTLVTCNFFHCIGTLPFACDFSLFSAYIVEFMPISFFDAWPQGSNARFLNTTRNKKGSLKGIMRWRP